MIFDWATYACSYVFFSVKNCIKTCYKQTLIADLSYSRQGLESHFRLVAALGNNVNGRVIILLVNKWALINSDTVEAKEKIKFWTR